MGGSPGGMGCQAPCHPPPGHALGQGEGGNPPPLPPKGAQPLSPRRQVWTSAAFVTDSNRPQPLWQPPPTACPTAAAPPPEVPSLLLMHPCPCPPVPTDAPMRNAVSEALGCLWPQKPEGMLRGIRRVTLRWSLEHAQVPYFTLPDPTARPTANNGTSQGDPLERNAAAAAP